MKGVPSGSYLCAQGIDTYIVSIEWMYTPETFYMKSADKSVCMSKYL